MKWLQIFVGNSVLSTIDIFFRMLIDTLSNWSSWCIAKLTVYRTFFDDAVINSCETRQQFLFSSGRLQICAPAKIRKNILQKIANDSLIWLLEHWSKFKMSFILCKWNIKWDKCFSELQTRQGLILPFLNRVLSLFCFP